MKGSVGTSTTLIGAAGLRAQGQTLNARFNAPRKNTGTWDLYLKTHWPTSWKRIYSAWEAGKAVKSLKLKGPFRDIVINCWKEWNRDAAAEKLKEVAETCKESDVAV